MKKQKLFLLAVLLISIKTFAQDISYGVRGGLNVANFSMNLPSNIWPAGNKKEARTHFNIGVFAQHQLNDKMALQTELFYSGEGASFSKPGTEMPEHIKLGYLSLPLFFKYTIADHFYAMAGPQISYLLSAKCIYANGNSYDVIKEHKKIAIGFVPVIGYDWNKFSINLRYQIGLSKLPKTPPNWSMTHYTDDQVKSNVFSAVISYTLF